MLDLARQKAPSVSLHQGDMRDLPVYGEFDLVTCLDDGLNYILNEQDLRRCFASFARNLAPEGRAIWDLNTLFQYRSQFAEDRVRDGGAVYLGWMGQVENRSAMRGSVVEVMVDVFERRDDGAWERRTGIHRQRHWPVDRVIELAESAGLNILLARGQFRGARLGGEPDEQSHAKIVYVACHLSERQNMVGDP
jgi:SAM-dependent methyltransferase